MMLICEQKLFAGVSPRGNMIENKMIMKSLCRFLTKRKLPNCKVKVTWREKLDCKATGL